MSHDFGAFRRSCKSVQSATHCYARRPVRQGGAAYCRCRSARFPLVVNCLAHVAEVDTPHFGRSPTVAVVAVVAAVAAGAVRFDTMRIRRQGCSVAEGGGGGGAADSLSRSNRWANSADIAVADIVVVDIAVVDIADVVDTAADIAVVDIAVVDRAAAVAGTVASSHALIGPS